MEIKERVQALRELMKEHEVEAYLIPSTDPHSSEYVPECWQRRKWISGFTGSAGDVVITSDQGGLWTDGRYFIQAEEQLRGSGIDLYKMLMPDTPKLEDWIGDQLEEGQYLGVDPRVLSVDGAKKLDKKLSEKGIGIKYIDKNLVDEIWEDRPKPSKTPVRVLDDEITGESIGDKFSRIREKMEKEDVRAHVLSSLDTIAWTLNMRGSDVDYNPVFISYMVVEMGSVHLFVDGDKITEEAKEHLEGVVDLHGYDEVGPYLNKISKQEIGIWLDPKTANKWIHNQLRGKPRFHMDRSPVTDFKARKNEVELSGIREAHIRDGVAMVKFLKWLRDEVQNGEVTELSAAEKLEGFRSQQDDFVGPSFETISGFKEHGAIIHYAASEESNVPIKGRGIYLVDSGGQYLMGTTDITRTVCFGEPTDEEKEMFTRVLKGHIGLATLKFPKGFSGKQIELPARKSLWDAGKNYNHGTGHGIGHYLNVHEGPMGITPRDTGVPLDSGMVLSNEPGYYKEGGYGIRIENIVVIREEEDLSSDELTFLCFDTVTLCPIDNRLIDVDMLTKEELEWLNLYHYRVREMLSPHLEGGDLEWLKESTKPL